MVNFKEFMSAEKTINRWFVLKVAIGGAFCGALLAIVFSFAGLL